MCFCGESKVDALRAYNRLMFRAAVFPLLILSLVTIPSFAQRGVSSFNPGFTGLPAHSGSMRIADGSFRGFHHRPLRRDHADALFAPYWFPYDDVGGYEQPYLEAAPPDSRPVVIQTAAPDHVPGVPKIIEVPRDLARAEIPPSAKPLPPAIFILKNGERLEAQRFLLRNGSLSCSINHQPRTIPLDSLDLDATLAANRERGIDLHIPADPNEISLSF